MFKNFILSLAHLLWLISSGSSPLAHHSWLISPGSSLLAHHSWLITSGSSDLAHHLVYLCGVCFWLIRFVSSEGWARNGNVSWSWTVWPRDMKLGIQTPYGLLIILVTFWSWPVHLSCLQDCYLLTQQCYKDVIGTAGWTDDQNFFDHNLILTSVLVLSPAWISLYPAML